MIDYQEIIEQLDDDKVKQLLDSLDIPYDDRGSVIIMPTVCHNADAESASWKLYYYKNTHVFQCYTEDGAMSIFTFLKNYYECRDIEYNWYEDILQVILNCSAAQRQVEQSTGYHSIRDNYSIKKSRQELEAYPEEVLDVFIKYYPIEWLNDGISRAAMDKFNIRYSPSQNKIIIPHYDAAGRLVGIRGRALNEWEIELIPKDSSLVEKDSNGHWRTIGAGKIEFTMRLKDRPAVTKDFEIFVNEPTVEFSAYIEGPDTIKLDRYSTYELQGSSNLVGAVEYSLNQTELASITEIKENKCIIHANAKNKLGEIILSAVYDGKTYTKTIKIVPLW